MDDNREGDVKLTMSERIPFHVEVSRIIDLLAKQIYKSPLALLRENCQNAYDAILQRQYLSQSFQSEIAVKVTPTQIVISDNGIGMTRDELKQHYWTAGSSGKNNPEARAAGVVGTFGIGAMANFGIAEELLVETESATNSERTKCHASRATLSTTEDCIQISEMRSTGQPGTIVIAKIPATASVDVAAAKAYVTECVRYLTIPVTFNGQLVSQEDFEASVAKPPSEWSTVESDAVLGPQITADVELLAAKTGEVWLALRGLRYSGKSIEGIMLLRQGVNQIRTFRSKFALATTAISSFYAFGGVANIAVLQPTAGREALTTSSLQLLQTIVTESEKYVSEALATTPLSNLNTGFMGWVRQHGRFELCSKLQIKLEPENRSMALEEVRERSNTRPFNYFEGSDRTLIEQYATEGEPLLVLSSRQPRKNCELAYLQAYCKVNRVADAPTVLSTKHERELTLAESALALRMISILESDYFVSVRVKFGKISHNLPVLVDTSGKPIEIVLDNDGATVATMLSLYEGDFTSLSSLVRDFVRNIIFQKLARFVPSGTRQGAEAFLRAIRRPRDVFEIERSDLGSLGEIWEEYLEGKISLGDAARQSTNIVRTTVQVVDRSATRSVATVIPDVLENQQLLENIDADDEEEQLEPFPAITRLDRESSVKLLTIEENETPLKGYRCFIALTDRVREDRGEFFLQPHRTQVVWTGQKAFYFFEHHSGEFGLYYELQGMEVMSDAPGGKKLPTCTIVLKNQIYIPVPDEIRQKFIPSEDAKKTFEVRCELLYPDMGADQSVEGDAEN